jgi:site-specific DNA recombinase
MVTAMPTITTKPRAVVYGRLSYNPDGTPSASVADQLRVMTEVAERSGYAVAHVLEDDGVGASRYTRGKRHGYAALLDLVESGQVQAIASWEVSRLSRDMGGWIRLRDLCEARGVVVITNSGTLDWSSDGDRLSGGVLGLVAEQEARATSKRVKRSRDTAAAEGKPHGRATFGYRRTYSEAGRLAGVEVVADEAAILIEAARHVLAGASLTGFVRRLNEEGVPSPNMATAARMGRPVAPSPWSITQTKKMLVRESYVGLRVHRGEVVGAADWPALWDLETHKQLRALFDARAQGTRQRVIKHWLSGVLVCSICGQSLRVSINKGKPSYACAVPCRKVAIAQHLVEDALAEMIVRVVADGRLQRQETSRVTDLKAELAVASERLSEAATAFAEGRLGVTALSAVEARMEPLQAALKDELARATAPVVAVDPNEVTHRWTELPADRKRAIARLALGRVIVSPSGGKKVDPMERLRFPDLDLSGL